MDANAMEPWTVDFRTDSSSLPTEEMRQAMAMAKVGNDYYGEDPTVNGLEKLAAQRLGKEAALFVTSGTMGNLLAILAFGQRGEEIIVGEQSHIANNEAGGASAWGGVAYHTVPENDDGMLDLDALEKAIRPRSNLLSAPSALVAIENTHNVLGGQPLSADQTRSIAKIAHENDIMVHVDGARIFHAEVALGVPVAELVSDVDSVTFCLSKSLQCPVGSLLCGSRSLIGQARKLRTALGGQMRQAGILAAAGIVALESIDRGRLADEHAKADKLALGLDQVPGMWVEAIAVRTNLVYVRITAKNPGELAQRLEREGIRGPDDSFRWRFVTYSNIRMQDIDRCIDLIYDTFRNHGMF